MKIQFLSICINPLYLLKIQQDDWQELFGTTKKVGYDVACATEVRYSTTSF